jgi:hypothetical protein
MNSPRVGRGLQDCSELHSLIDPSAYSGAEQDAIRAAESRAVQVLHEAAGPDAIRYEVPVQGETPSAVPVPVEIQSAVPVRHEAAVLDATRCVA